VITLHVGIDDGLAARVAGGALGLGGDSISIVIYLQIPIELTYVNV
jgi:hypothetical protein